MYTINQALQKSDLFLIRHNSAVVTYVQGLKTDQYALDHILLLPKSIHCAVVVLTETTPKDKTNFLRPQELVLFHDLVHGDQHVVLTLTVIVA